MEQNNNAYKGISEMQYGESSINYQSAGQGSNMPKFNLGKNKNLLFAILAAVVIIAGVIVVIGFGGADDVKTSRGSSAYYETPEDCVKDFMKLVVKKPSEAKKYYKKAYPSNVAEYMIDFLEKAQDSMDGLSDAEVEEELDAMVFQPVHTTKFSSSELKGLEEAIEYDMDEEIDFDKGWIVETNVTYMGEMIPAMEFIVLQYNGEIAIWGAEGEYIWESF